MAAVTNFNCSEKGCLGNVCMDDPGKGVVLQTGCANHSMAFPCDECGRLYFGPDAPVVDRGNPPNRVFIKDGKMVRLPPL
jgi:hypothetical protein